MPFRRELYILSFCLIFLFISKYSTKKIVYNFYLLVQQNDSNNNKDQKSLPFPLKRLLDPFKKNCSRGFPGGAVVENLPANAGDTGSSPGLGGSHMPRSN